MKLRVSLADLMLECEPTTEHQQTDRRSDDGRRLGNCGNVVDIEFT